MFLLYLLGCQISYSSIFCQFWLFFVFKFLLSFFWLCKEVQCVYLRLHLGPGFLLVLLDVRLDCLFQIFLSPLGNIPL